MTNVIVYAVFFFACYGSLTAVADLLRWLGNRELRRAGHNPALCDECSGRSRRKHQAELVRVELARRRAMRGKR